jgi:hypothetical protein
VDDDLDSREEARTRRRDRDAAASERALMRPGLGKQFKQVLDAQVRRGHEAEETLRQRKAPKKPG